MRKLFTYSEQSYSDISNILKNNFSESEDNNMNPYHQVFYSTLMSGIRFKSKMPTTLKLKMTLTLIKKNNYTTLLLDVKTQKILYMSIIVFVATCLISFLVFSLTWENFIWLFPILILYLRYHHKIVEDINFFERNVLSTIK